MASEKTENFIKELSDTQIEALQQLQFGLPVGVIGEQTITSLDERDLINTIQYTSARSQIAIPGFALSDQGNQIVEELARRNREEARRRAGVPEPVVKEAAKKTTKKKKESDEEGTE